MSRRIALAAEAAAVVAGDDADVRGRHLQHARQLAMQVVRILRARPERQLAVALDRGERGVLLHRQVGVALVEEQVLEYVVGLRQRLLDVAELEGLVAMDVALRRYSRGCASPDAPALPPASRWSAAACTSLRSASSASSAVCSSFATTAATGSPT